MARCRATCFRLWPTRRPKAGRSLCWQKKSTACADVNWLRTKRCSSRLHRANPHVGVNLDGREDSQRSVDAITKYLHQFGTSLPREIQASVERFGALGEGTPAVVAEDQRALGVIYLKDIRQRRHAASASINCAAMGIKTVMNHRRQSPDGGGDRTRSGRGRLFWRRPTPKDKMDLIRREQADGKLVAMTATAPTMRPPSLRPMWAWP